MPRIKFGGVIRVCQYIPRLSLACIYNTPNLIGGGLSLAGTLARIAQLVERRALGRKVLGSNHWVVTLSCGSLSMPRCKTGTRPWLGKSVSSECRRWWIHPSFETHGQSQPKSETKSTSGSTKWWLVIGKFLKKITSNRSHFYLYSILYMQPTHRCPERSLPAILWTFQL